MIPAREVNSRVESYPFSSRGAWLISRTIQGRMSMEAVFWILPARRWCRPGGGGAYDPPRGHLPWTSPDDVMDSFAFEHLLEIRT